jgi:hypothetical protein
MVKNLIMTTYVIPIYVCVCVCVCVEEVKVKVIKIYCMRNISHILLNYIYTTIVNLMHNTSVLHAFYI